MLMFPIKGFLPIACQYLYTLCFSFIAMNCGPLDVPLNGSLTGNETTFPNEVSFSCDKGFILNGSTTRSCQADGAWGGVLTMCKGKSSVCR